MAVDFSDRSAKGMMATRELAATAFPQGRRQTHDLVAEVPVAIVLQGTSVAVMMASPTDLKDFAVGFAFTEGFISGLHDVVDLEIVEHGKGIEARLWLTDDKADAFIKRRRSMAGPVGCGLCGIDSLEEATRSVPHVSAPNTELTFDELNAATEALRNYQPIHDQTRAAHGAGFVMPQRGIVEAREDVGRHNALDKLIGGLLREENSPAEGAIVMTSRVSVELVQKTAIAGCPIIVAVSAPTTFAVETAEAAGVTLAALSKGDGFKVFTHPERIRTVS
ncbi:MAG: formate dehydrogenase accessory sulfurtransferase FdhD [Pseudomonadota bacterium]